MKKGILGILFLIFSHTSFCQQNTFLPEILTDNPCYFHYNLLKESFQIKYVYKNSNRTHIIYGDNVNTTGDRAYLLKVNICETGEERIFHCYDFGEFDCLPFVVNIKMKDSILAITYLFEVESGKNWEVEERETFTKFFCLGRDSLYFVSKKIVFQKSEITSSQNKEQLSKLLFELKKIKMGGSHFLFEEKNGYWEKLLACVFAGYADSEKLFLDLDKYVIIDGIYADVYFHAYNIYKNVKPILKNK